MDGSGEGGSNISIKNQILALDRADRRSNTSPQKWSIARVERRRRGFWHCPGGSNQFGVLLLNGGPFCRPFSPRSCETRC